MRYISHKSNLVLYRNDGNIGRDDLSDKAYVFGQNGELIIGSTTTAVGVGNYIDASSLTDTTQQLQLLYPTDCDGNQVTRIEMAGLGTLTGVTKTSGAVSPLIDGYRDFFEAPTLTGTTAVPATAGIWYLILTGSVTYNSVAYVAGQKFETNGTTTATTGTGTFRVTIPPELEKTCNNPTATAGVFAYKELYKGNEGTNYWNYGDGIDPKDSTTSTDADYYGWME